MSFSQAPTKRSCCKTDKAYAEHRNRPGLGNGLGVAAATESGAAEVAAAAAVVEGRAIIGDGVGIHRHCSILREGSPAQNLCVGSQGDAIERENISRERSGCTESRGPGARTASDAEQPKHADIWTAIDHLNRRGACGRERGPYLENEDRTRIALSVESERAVQLSRRRELIDARVERADGRSARGTQIVTSQVHRERLEL